MSKRQLRWDTRLAEIAQFSSQHSRLPSSKSKDVDERTLGNFLRDIRRDAKKGATRITPARVAQLDMLIPDWDGNFDLAWDANMDAVTAFVSDTGRYPDRDSKDPREAALGIWLMNARYRKFGDPAKRAARVQRLDAELPAWRVGNHKSDNSKWETWATRFREFIARKGHLPNSQSAVVTEAELGAWLENQVARTKPKVATPLSKEEIQTLKDITPIWNSKAVEPVSFTWLSTVHVVKAFVAEQGRWPSVVASNVSQHEIALTQWLRDQRIAKNSGRGAAAMTPSQMRYLAKHLPGWFTGNLG